MHTVKQMQKIEQADEAGGHAGAAPTLEINGAARGRAEPAS